MPDTAQKFDIIEKSEHYNTRRIETIEFIRHLDFALGSAFKYIWRFGLKDAKTLERGKRNYYLRDALVNRPVSVGVLHADKMIRHLSTEMDSFEPSQFDLLVAIITASTGDYRLLTEQARELKLFPVAIEHLTLKA